MAAPPGASLLDGCDELFAHATNNSSHPLPTRPAATRHRERDAPYRPGTRRASSAIAAVVTTTTASAARSDVAPARSPTSGGPAMNAA